jgi:hypothetical protein
VLPTTGDPEIVGGFELTGDPLGVETISVSFESAVLEPLAFVAVTRKRTVDPMSAAVSVYRSLVAPAMDAHVAPFSSQRTQTAAYVIGAVPFHLPLMPLSTLP